MKLRLLYIALLFMIGMIGIDLFHAWSDTSLGLSILFRNMIVCSLAGLGYLLGKD